MNKNKPVVVPYKEKRVEKLYYSIGEVALKFDVNPSAIRFWEKEFDFLNPKKNGKGNRMYTVLDLENIGMIQHLLKEDKLTIEGARNKIKNDRDTTFSRIEAIKTLTEIRNMLNQIKEEL